tara:strand:+ start:2710 stop:2961 length:252 start_codon:yes stop_codon:yes gene_type:complete
MSKRYTEGITGDGAAILDNGIPITIIEILNRLNDHDKLVSTVKSLHTALKDLLEEVDREGWNINGEDYQEQTNARKALEQVPE